MADIRRIRQKVLKLTQVAFAKVCGVGQPTVSRWENGGGGGPKHIHLSRMRSFAIRSGVAWNDSVLFTEAPKRKRGTRSTQKTGRNLTLRREEAPC